MGGVSERASLCARVSCVGEGPGRLGGRERKGRFPRNVPQEARKDV